MTSIEDTKALSPVDGSTLRIVTRVVVMLLATFGLKLAEGDLVGTQAAVELFLFACITVRQFRLNLPIAWAQLGRAAIRPILVIAAWKQFDLDEEQCLTAFMAIEMLVEVLKRKARKA